MDTRVLGRTNKHTGAITFKFYAGRAFNTQPTDDHDHYDGHDDHAMMLPKTTPWPNKNVIIKLYCPG